MSTKSLTFGTFFFDYDLDGLPDILAVNGHVSDDISVVQPNVKYAQPPHLFRNLGNNQFEEVTTKLGPALQKPIVGRGAAYADFDNDGDLDFVITANSGPARLLRNDNGNQNDVLRVKTIGTKSNRDGIGAKVTVRPATGTGSLAWSRLARAICRRANCRLPSALASLAGKNRECRDSLAQRRKGFHLKSKSESVHHGARRQGYRQCAADCVHALSPPD